MSFKISAIILLLSITCFGQKESAWSAGLHGGLNIGDYKDGFTSNIGVDISYLHQFSKRFYLGGATGFTNHFGEEPFFKQYGRGNRRFTIFTVGN